MRIAIGTVCSNCYYYIYIIDLISALQYFRRSEQLCRLYIIDMLKGFRFDPRCSCVATQAQHCHDCDSVILSQSNEGS